MRWSLGAVLMLVFVVGSGCGGDDTSESNTPMGGGDSAAPGDGDMTPVVTPPAGDGDMATPTPASMCDETVQNVTECGGTMCPDPGLFGTFCARTCCMDDKCGSLVALSGMAPTACTLPAEDDFDCPTFSFANPLTGTMDTLNGCCVADMNRCGVNFIGVCLDINSLAMRFGLGGMGMPTDTTGMTDAGMTDGGMTDAGTLGDAGSTDAMMTPAQPDPGFEIPPATDCDGNLIE